MKYEEAIECLLYDIANENEEIFEKNGLLTLVKNFLKLFPENTILPDISYDKSSDYIDLDWDTDDLSGNTFVIVLYSNGNIMYAGLFGKKSNSDSQEIRIKVNGTDIFDGKTLPESIKRHLDIIAKSD